MSNSADYIILERSSCVSFISDITIKLVVLALHSSCGLLLEH